MKTPKAERGRPALSPAHPVPAGGPAPVAVRHHPGAALQRQVQRMADAAPRAQPLQALQRAADVRAALVGSSQPIQRRGFDAGIGAGWHIHFGDHVKYASNNATRVDFGGRSRRDIGFQWEQVIQNNGLAATKQNADFVACKHWIRDHIA